MRRILRRWKFWRVHVADSVLDTWHISTTRDTAHYVSMYSLQQTPNWEHWPQNGAGGDDAWCTIFMWMLGKVSQGHWISIVFRCSALYLTFEPATKWGWWGRCLVHNFHMDVGKSVTRPLNFHRVSMVCFVSNLRERAGITVNSMLAGTLITINAGSLSTARAAVLHPQAVHWKWSAQTFGYLPYTPQHTPSVYHLLIANQKIYYQADKTFWSVLLGDGAKRARARLQYHSLWAKHIKRFKYIWSFFAPPK